MEEIIRDIYDKIVGNDNGKVANYIPQLEKVNPDLLGISFCGIDGSNSRIEG